MQSIDSIETYSHGMSKDLIYKREKIKDIIIIKQFNQTIQISKKYQNEDWNQKSKTKCIRKH